MAIFAYQPLEIARTNQVYAYPVWANVLGWVVAASSCSCIPIVAVYNMCTSKGSFTEV
jgi:solute carrier family 6 dopamine transporter-like protein 3